MKKMKFKPARLTNDPFLGPLGWLKFLVLILSLSLSACSEVRSDSTSNPTSAAVTEPSPSSGTLTVAPPYWPTKGWLTSTPEEQGVDSIQLLRTLQHIEQDKLNIRTLTVIRNGYVVLEAAKQPFTLDMSYSLQSVTKSVIGALVGIAIKEGYLKDVKQTVLSFFPERTITNRDKNKEAITIEDLLTMRSGLDCSDDKHNLEWINSKDWVQFTLDLPMASPPGQQFAYCTAGVHLLSAILTKATGMSTADYAQSRLFGPLGITSSNLSWGTDPRVSPLGVTEYL